MALTEADARSKETSFPIEKAVLNSQSKTSVSHFRCKKLNESQTGWMLQMQRHSLHLTEQK
jgi:hypothetical protein